MIVKPRVRGFLCTTAHPEGCSKNIREQVDYVRSKDSLTGIDNALVVGCSAGFGLASRISAAFGCGANTYGVSLEKEPSEKKTGSAGWYNNLAFDRTAHTARLDSISFNGDAFAWETKNRVINELKKQNRTLDLMVYSLASPVREHPTTHQLYRSAIKPIGAPLESRTIKFDVLKEKYEVTTINIEPASNDEIESTVAVMGGEDWQMWCDALAEANVLSKNFKTIAYTYLGNELTWPVYRGGTLGRAKEHLDQTCKELNGKYGSEGFEALVAVLKAVVTQASMAIPVVPLYFSILFQEMKKAGTHEDCIQHIHRLFQEQLFSDLRRVDDEGRIRMDNFELDDEVQERVAQSWEQINTDNIRALADIRGFRTNFLKLFGFERSDVDYDQEVDPMYRVDVQP